MNIFLLRLLIPIVEYFENLLIAYPPFTAFVLKNSPPGILTTLGKIKALYIFNNTAKNVPAYRDFLKQNKIDYKKINSYKDFVNNVPATTKENYVNKYHLWDRNLKNKRLVSGCIDESAGSSGKPTMWIRSQLEEKKLFKLIGFGLYYTFDAFSKPNIIILNCWSPGPWTTGIKFTQIAQKSSIVKMIGTDKDNVINTMKTLGTNNDFIICGYPPFIKDLLDYGNSKGFNWSKYYVRFISGGEGFSEEWRRYIKEQFLPKKTDITSAYGAADIDIGIGFETRLTKQIMNIAHDDLEFRKYFFGTDSMPAFLGIHNPLTYNIETEKNGDLVFTSLNPDVISPKVRYNLKDAGFVIGYNDLKQKLLNSKYKNKIDFKNALNLPLVAIFGRSDGTISLDGANIYPTEVQAAIFRSKIVNAITSFIMEPALSIDKSIYFKINIELNSGTERASISDEEIAQLSGTIRDYLLFNNVDYKESYTNNPKSLEPHIEIFEFNQGLFKIQNEKIKRNYLQSNG